MSQLVVTIAPEPDRTRILMADGEQDILKAILPAVRLAHPRAASTLLEGLALWHQQRLCVALLVDGSEESSDALSLYDGLGYGDRTVHYEVGVAVRERRRRRRRIDGLGSFQDLRVHRLGVVR